MTIANIEDLTKALSDGAQATPINAPSFYFSAMRIASSANGVQIVCSRAAPVEINYKDEQILAAKNEPICVLEMSPGTAKDLVLLLKGQLEELENLTGPIVTEFTKSLEK